ncbi:hypothetical protein CW354_01560 [Marinicaulis flavus]|uniref:DUF3604 domain-containing protein n=2 Tax=Hyphococcus luteus TaxID=2058213 RepID=A0A2S7KB79_9PROT|nr:hypothetical protein CW354_01560 [Marinicaulis flavus]
MQIKLCARCFLIAAALLIAACAQETSLSEETSEAAKQTSEAGAGETSAPPPSRPNPLRNVYFGDLHLHTRNSYDAYLFNVRATPEDAYAYAKGGTIKHPMGFDLQMNSGPLDFLAVTDHAEYLGVLEAIDTPGTEYSKAPYAKDLFSSDRGDVIAAFGHFVVSLRTGEILPELSDMSATKSAWRQTIDSAERNYEPGVFTTFIGYEFTSLPEMRNLHRNVIFASDKAPPAPFSAFDAQNPEDLWRWLDAKRAEGMEALAIPHNANASDGTMFERVKWNGQPIDRAYAELRMRNEPLVEIIQTKGQSETLPLLSPNDEFAGFEVMDLYVGSIKPVTTFAGGYVRDALKRGLETEARIGANPYKMGVVAGSDGHNAAAPYEEDNYFANHGVLDGKPELRGSVPPPDYESWDAYYADGGRAPRAMGSGGLTGVWAEENTRASLFAAMRRKETFGTSGPRIRVRLFAGYGLEGVNLATDEGVRAAYENGVPMGGDLVAKQDETPQFAVIAMRDIHSAPLQRIQIVKGWTDETGKSFEKVFDVACADNGAVDPATHRCPDNGATADLETCEFSEDKGDAELQSLWTDPEFDPAQNAFYYARVLENPTCRWSTWDAIRAGVAPNPKLAKTIQERAYTSPIWFTPANDDQ